jgi:hypothetical protein
MGDRFPRPRLGSVIRRHSFPKERTMKSTRRSAFTAGLGLAALASMHGRADAAERTATEKANVQVVNDFCAAWPSHNIDRIMSYFAEDCAIA